MGVLCSRRSEGLGIDDPELREQVGEDKHHPAPPCRLTKEEASFMSISDAQTGPPPDDGLLTEIDHVAILVRTSARQSTGTATRSTRSSSTRGRRQ